MTRRFRLLLSGAFALLAVVLCIAYGQGVREEADRVRSEAIERYGGEVVQLVVATEALEAGDVIDQRNTTQRDWLADLAPTDAVTDYDEVLGREVSVPAAAGAPLTALNFRDDASAVEVPSGTVALAVPVTEKLGLPASASAGTTLAAYEVTSEGAQLIAASVDVLRVPGETSSFSSTRGAVTLAVQPEEVSGVLTASAEGSLRLALPADDVEGLGVTAAPTEVAPETEESGEAGGNGAHAVADVVGTADEAAPIDGQNAEGGDGA